MKKTQHIQGIQVKLFLKYLFILVFLVNKNNKALPKLTEMAIQRIEEWSYKTNKSSNFIVVTLTVDGLIHGGTHPNHKN